MSLPQFELVVFDWDGTLMDSTHSIVEAIQGAARDVGLPEPTKEQASWVIGLSLESALFRAVPSLTPSLMPKFLERYRIRYLLRDGDLQLFDGARALLDELAGLGIKLAVATGKRRDGLNRALAATGLGPRFDATRCADETFSKPHPRMLHELMSDLDVEPVRVVMVGDTSHDMQMAINAGVAGLGVTYGAQSREDLTAPGVDGVVSSVAEMRDWLLPRLVARV